MRNVNVHLGQLGRRAAGDLLYPQCEELVFQLRQLLCQVILGPGEERTLRFSKTRIVATLQSRRTLIEVRMP